MRRIVNTCMDLLITNFRDLCAFYYRIERSDLLKQHENILDQLCDCITSIDISVHLHKIMNNSTDISKKKLYKLIDTQQNLEEVTNLRSKAFYHDVVHSYLKYRKMGVSRYRSN